MSSSSSFTTNESDGDEHIKVCVRIRPVVRSERDQGEILSWNWENNQITQLEKPISKHLSNYQAQALSLGNKSSYYFDHLFYPEHTNRDIFDSVVKSVVNQCMNGFHGSVFTYGQTSSGKTFTMTGNTQQPGIIPQAIGYCFDSINSFSDREFLVRVSYLEIYNEQVKDLLNSEVVAIKIQHDPKNGTVITGVKEQVVVNAEQTISYIRAGEAHRHVGATDMNEKSSRAHTLFKMTIESRERNGSSVPAGNGYAPVRVSTLNLVDLAGSENAKQTNSKGDRALEARYINQSLLTLSTIIHKLSEEKPGMTPLARRQHLPYRDSKLTRILQPSLDGNAHIAVICTISPVLSCVDETNNTLKFASRAKTIKMNAKVNDVMDEKTLLKVYREEIEQLKAKLFELEMQSKLYAQTALTAASVQKSSSHDDADDEQNMLLQMITEMESMILKADKRMPSENSSGNSTPSGVSPAAKMKRMSSNRMPSPPPRNRSERDAGGIAMNEQAKAMLSKSTSRALSPEPSPSVKLPKPPSKTAVKSTPVDKKTALSKDASKSRFGFGFGFKGQKGPSPTPEASNARLMSPETKDSNEKTKVETPKEHEAVFQEEVDGDDYNSVDDDNRRSILDRQSSVSRVQSFRGDDVGDKVLFGVSKMLAALKMHIGKTRGGSNPPRKVSHDNEGILGNLSMFY